MRGNLSTARTSTIFPRACALCRTAPISPTETGPRDVQQTLRKRRRCRPRFTEFGRTAGPIDGTASAGAGRHQRHLREAGQGQRSHTAADGSRLRVLGLVAAVRRQASDQRSLVFLTAEQQNRSRGNRRRVPLLRSPGPTQPRPCREATGGCCDSTSGPRTSRDCCGLRSCHVARCAEALRR